MAIISSGLIPNHQPQDNALNPWETHFYLHNTVYSPPPGFCTHVSWIIYGDIPKSVSINPSTGVISGNICYFGKQPSCQNNKPKKQILFDGTNWDDNGRFKELYYDFHFTIQRNTLVAAPPSGCGSPVPFVETSSVYIRVVKNHNIDNKIFMKMYLDEGKPGTFDDEENVPTSININGNVYENSSSALSNHKGPFKDPNC